jgi:F-type H+-transporting ATPase subunit delta
MVAKNKEIDLIGQRVAAIYGKAVFDAADSSGNQAEVIEQLDSLVADVLDQSPKLDELLTNPMIAAEHKLGVIKAIFSGRALPIVLSFLQAVAKNERLNHLRSIIDYVHQLKNEQSNVRLIGATTALPLSPELEQRLSESTGTLLGCRVELETDVDPSMIGGVILRIGDTVYDGSVAARLERLRKQMSQGVVEAIENNHDEFEN